MWPPFLRSLSLHTDAAGSAPDAFGPFRVLHQIGAGTLGPVFRAFDPDRDRLVAIKLFTIDLPPERVHQVVAELERLLAAALTHPAIAAPLATGIHDNHPFLAQEYVAADSLDVSVREHGPAAPGHALRIAAQLASGLDFAAIDNIVHGALHPRDVLLTPDDARLTGLGIARAFERASVAPPVRRPYSAPECMAGSAWDRRADVFSLAALMHEMLWGRRVAATGAQAGEALTELPGGDLDALRALFARALAENPADRFDTALEFAEGLKQAFPNVTLTTPRAQRPAPRAAELEPRLPLDEPEPAVVAQVVKPAATAPEVQVRTTSFEDLDIREAETARYETVESARAIPEPAPADGASAPAELAAGLLNGYTDSTSFAIEQSRSAVWPLMLALIVGVAIGFGGGYFFANYERASAPQAAATGAQAGQAGREWTESAVTEPSKTPAAALGAGSAHHHGRRPPRPRSHP